MNDILIRQLATMNAENQKRREENKWNLTESGEDETTCKEKDPPCRERRSNHTCTSVGGYFGSLFK